MKGPVLGIDLGTTNSVVAVAGDAGIDVLTTPEGHRLIPSVVSFHPSGEVLVGRAARDRRLLDAQNTVYSVKRLIGRPFESREVQRAKERFAFEFAPSASGGVLVASRGETYTLSEISAFVLREVRRVAELATGGPCTRAVITVPANFNELQRSATKAAGRVAGLEVLRILNEPTAAALAYGYGSGSRERVAIFDLGGGTFDVTILELAGEVFEVVATAGDTYLGGDDIDQLIAEQMAEAFLAHHRYDPRGDRQAYERLRAAAEWAKCQLSAEEEVQLRIEELAYGEGGVSLDLTFGLSRQGLEAMAMPLLARAFDVCEEAMNVAGVRPTQIDQVILVGGSTRMPLVHRMVEDYFGKQPLATIDPDLVVAQGAALQGQALATSRAKSRLGRVTLRRVSQVGMRPAAAVEEVQVKGDPRAAGYAPPPPPPP
ncbi:MAG TPA: Hsp70 family protein, partial [Polyangiaceae bacterium LLY-WYZ-15_(1-7)]|nr:Hsp70 family protein [Polyangiaceae bacterium LLY-WYZ-15_(1-7)]